MLPDNWGWLGNVASQRNVANSADRFGGFSIARSKIAIFAMQLNVMLLTQDYCFFPKRSILTFYIQYHPIISLSALLSHAT